MAAITGPKLSDRQGQAAAATQSALTALGRAAVLRSNGNDEHAADYDAIAERMFARAARFAA